MMSLMPPLPARGEGGTQPVVDWIESKCRVDRETARKTFESAKQAEYLVMRDVDGKRCWVFDAESGYNKWHTPPESVQAKAPLKMTRYHVRTLLALAENPPIDRDNAADAALAVAGCTTAQAVGIIDDLVGLGLLTQDGKAIENLII
jgi:hypothetical protein